MSDTRMKLLDLIRCDTLAIAVNAVNAVNALSFIFIAIACVSILLAFHANLRGVQAFLFAIKNFLGLMLTSPL